MHGETAVDALVDAGTGVAGAVSSLNRGQLDTVVVGTLLVLAAERVPLLWLLIVGYVVRSAREGTGRLWGFDDWRRLGSTGIRATAVLAVGSLPTVAFLAATGVLDYTAAGIGLSSNPEIWTLVVAAGLTAVAWHCAVAGLLVIARTDSGADTPLAAGIRIARSVAGRRLSLAAGGLTVTVAVVRFSLRALPVVGPLFAAVVTFVGVAIATELLRERVAAHALRADRLAAREPGTARATGSDQVGGGGGAPSDRAGPTIRLENVERTAEREV